MEEGDSRERESDSERKGSTKEGEGGRCGLTSTRDLAARPLLLLLLPSSRLSKSSPGAAAVSPACEKDGCVMSLRLGRGWFAQTNQRDGYFSLHLRSIFPSQSVEPLADRALLSFNPSQAMPVDDGRFVLPSSSLRTARLESRTRASPRPRGFRFALHSHPTLITPAHLFMPLLIYSNVATDSRCLIIVSLVPSTAALF